MESDVVAAHLLDADLLLRSQTVLTVDEAKGLAVKARSISAGQLLALVNDRLNKDATAGRGVSTMQLYKLTSWPASRPAGAWSLSPANGYLTEDDNAVVRLVKTILSGIKYDVEISTFQSVEGTTTVRLTVRWLSPAGDDLSAIWTEAMDVIKAQAARVLRDKQPLSAQQTEGTQTESNQDDEEQQSAPPVSTALDGTVVPTRDSIKAQAAARVLQEQQPDSPGQAAGSGTAEEEQPVSEQPAGSTTSSDADYEKFSDSELD